MATIQQMLAQAEPTARTTPDRRRRTVGPFTECHVTKPNGALIIGTIWLDIDAIISISTHHVLKNENVLIVRLDSGARLEILDDDAGDALAEWWCRPRT